MATENKKYLDLAGLEYLINKLQDEKRIVSHKTPDGKDFTAADPAAVKVGMDANGHVQLGTALSYNDLTDLPTIGNGTLKLQANGVDKGTFTANQTNNTTINITAADLGLASALSFAGTTTTALTDGSTTNPIKVNNADYTAIAGNVVLYNDKEFIWNGTIWEELGDEASHALKSIKIEAGDGLTGGGDLTQNRTISHGKTTAADAAPVSIGKDEFGHVVIGTKLTTVSNGDHAHEVTSTIPADSFLKSATASTSMISLNKSSDTFLKGYAGTFGKLHKTTITGTDGTVTASKATAGTAVDVAKAGTAVVYGKADVGSTATVATMADTATKVGNANIGSEITITGVSGSVKASKAVAGAAVNVATTGTAMNVATKASEATTVGNANVGSEITITGVSGSVTASKATAKTAVTVAKAGEAVVYGKADCDTAVTGVAKVGSQITYGNANVGASATVATGIKSATATTDAYTASYMEDQEMLVLAPATVTPTVTVNTTSVTSAASSSTKAYVCADGTGVSITPAKAAPNTQTIVPAIANGTITPYEFADVTVPKAAAQQKFYSATSSTAQIYGVGDVVSVTPAVANGTITPWTFNDVTVPQAATEQKFYSAVESTNEIYGVKGTVDVTSAVAAPTTQTIIPAVANGSITPYTFADVVAAKKADAEIEVATGEISTGGKGAEVLVGLGTATTASALTAATVKADTTGDVMVATGITTTKNTVTSISGSTDSKGGHTHEIK